MIGLAIIIFILLIILIFISTRNDALDDKNRLLTLENRDLKTEIDTHKGNYEICNMHRELSCENTELFIKKNKELGEKIIRKDEFFEKYKNARDMDEEVMAAKYGDLKHFLPYYNVGDEIVYKLDSDVHIGTIHRIESHFKLGPDQQLKWKSFYIVIRKKIYEKLEHNDIIKVIKESRHKIV